VKIEIETEPVIAPDYDSWAWKRKTSREREIPAMRPDAKNKQNGEEHPNLAAGIELSGKTNGAAAACFGPRKRKASVPLDLRRAEMSLERNRARARPAERYNGKDSSGPEATGSYEGDSAGQKIKGVCSKPKHGR
jgi:hypothetical protein